MTYRVRVTDPAKQDIKQNRDWWAEHHCAEQAAQWFLGIDKAVKALAETADRHRPATETVLRQACVRQVAFGLGPKPSHRILYGFHGEEVVVYRVRAYRQDRIGVDDLDGENTRRQS